jgi:predicted ribosomally synthesized peptide with nif11-like leader
MSRGHAQALFERLKADGSFRSRVLAESLLDNRLKVIRDEGFDCTPDEIADESHRLGDAELGEVAAAGGCILYHPCAAYDW